MKMTIEDIQEYRQNAIDILKRNDQFATAKAIDYAFSSLIVLEQIKWERDIALEQLEELGYSFGEKVWFSCDELLPSSDGKFEVTIKGKNGKRHVEMCDFHKDAKSTPWGIENWEHGNVIAWRKRPKPYKERKGNNYETKN